MHEQHNQSHRRFSSDAGRPSLRPRPRPETQNKKPARRQLDAHEHVLLNSKRNASSVAVTLMSGKEVEGVVIDFDASLFPYFMEWKSMGAGDYVVGLEPSNSSVHGRGWH